MIFNIFTIATITNEFNARSLDNRWNVFRNLHKDRAFIGVIVVSVLVQALLIEFGGTFVKTTGLTAKDWGITIGIAVGLVLPLGILQRFIPVDNAESDMATFYLSSFNARMAALSQQQQLMKDNAAKPLPGFFPTGNGLIMAPGAYEAPVGKPTLIDMTGMASGTATTATATGVVAGTGAPGAGTGSTPPSTAITISSVNPSLVGSGGLEMVSPSPAAEPAGF